MAKTRNPDLAAANMQRKTCVYCNKKRYEKHMQLLFKHPILCKDGVYCCAKSTHRYGYNVRQGCEAEAISSIMLYAETGRLVVSPIKKTL